MEKIKRYKHFISRLEEDEEDKSVKAIKDLIELDWGKDENAQNTAVALFKALVLADTDAADKFIKNVSDYTSGLKVEQFKESLSNDYFHYLYVSLDSNHKKGAVVGFKSESSAENFKEYLEGVSNVSVFSVDFIGKLSSNKIDNFMKVHMGNPKIVLSTTMRTDEDARANPERLASKIYSNLK